jgi:hypothetical protein
VQVLGQGAGGAEGSWPEASCELASLKADE